MCVLDVLRVGLMVCMCGACGVRVVCAVCGVCWMDVRVCMCVFSVSSVHDTNYQ